MLYQQSLEIEKRLDTVLRLIRRGRHSTPKLAERLGVSIPTVSRYLTALRERGYDIRAERQASGWRYVLANTKPQETQSRCHPRLAELQADKENQVTARQE
jgi:biotin operon repressor